MSEQIKEYRINESSRLSGITVILGVVFFLFFLMSSQRFCSRRSICSFPIIPQTSKELVAVVGMLVVGVSIFYVDRLINKKSSKLIVSNSKIVEKGGNGVVVFSFIKKDVIKCAVGPYGRVTMVTVQRSVNFLLASNIEDFVEEMKRFGIPVKVTGSVEKYNSAFKVRLSILVVVLASVLGLVVFLYLNYNIFSDFSEKNNAQSITSTSTFQTSE